MTQDADAARANAVKGGSAIAVAVGIMNVSTYAFTILAARLMGTQPYGAFAAVMNVLLVAGVLTLALQATAARRIAREPGDVHAVEDTILVVGLRSALGLGLVFLAIAPLVNNALRLDSLLTAALMAVAVAPLTLMGAQLGVLQGERRWTALALVYLSAGVSRLAVGAALLWWRPEVIYGVLGVTVSAFVPVVIAWFALRQPRTKSEITGSHTAREVWWETVYNSQALLAFLVLSSVDIVIARQALSDHDAGLYAAGLIMVKAVMFLPQFVVVLAFPSMGTEGAKRSALLLSLGLVALTGIAVTVGVEVLSSLALEFVGGGKFSGIKDQLWVFAVLGTVLSMIQLLVYSVLARQARASVIVLWVSLLPLFVLGLNSSSVTTLVDRVLSVDSVLLAVLLGFTMWRLRHEDAPVVAVAVD